MALCLQCRGPFNDNWWNNTGFPVCFERVSLSSRRARITAAVEDVSTHRSVLRRCVSEMCKNTGVSKVFVNGRLKSNALTLTSRTQKPKPPTPQSCVFHRPKSHFWCETGRCHQSWWSKDDEKHQYYLGFSVCVEYSLTLKKPQSAKSIGFYRTNAWPDGLHMRGGKRPRGPSRNTQYIIKPMDF